MRIPGVNFVQKMLGRKNVGNARVGTPIDGTIRHFDEYGLVTKLRYDVRVKDSWKPLGHNQSGIVREINVVRGGSDNSIVKVATGSHKIDKDWILDAEPSVKLLADHDLLRQYHRGEPAAQPWRVAQLRSDLKTLAGLAEVPGGLKRRAMPGDPHSQPGGRVGREERTRIAEIAEELLAILPE